MVAQLSDVSGTFPSFVSSACLLGVHSVSSSMSFMKLLTNVGSSIKLWGTTSVWLSAGLCAADHSSLINPVIQTIFNSSYCPCVQSVFHKCVGGDVMGTVSKASLKTR